MAHIIDSPEQIEAEAENNAKLQGGPEQKLVAWVTSNCNIWRDDRDTKFKPRWEEYYRLWRGVWDAKDKTRKSERSRMITPATQQAVESVTSEIESAILDKPNVFDIIDNPGDTDNTDIMQLRTILREDLRIAGFDKSLNEIFLNGSIFGTGIGKLDAADKDFASIVSGSTGPEMSIETRVEVKLVPVLPSQFLIDPAAKTISEALGLAHEYTTPQHEVTSLQDAGVYNAGTIGTTKPLDPIISDHSPNQHTRTVNIIDYRGLVPRQLLEDVVPIELGEDEELAEIVEDLTENEPTEVDETDLVEAMIIIANSNMLLKATENKTVLKDRLFIAYRHEIVPDQFWGRGVCEKGYNSQKALDASMRARIDGLALTVHPMMGIDATKMPRGFSFTVSPGKSVLTQGNPDEVLKPIKFGNIDPNVFTDNNELERMVSMSTGALDAAAPVKVNGRNETAAGMSMQLGAMVKRSKRTIRNIEEEFILPMVQQTARLYMQLEPARYPLLDATFRVTSVLGTMARELEQQQYASMLNTVEQGTPAFWMLMRGIYQTSSLSNREEMLPIVEQQLQVALNPPPPPEDPLVELRRLEVTGKVRAEGARIQVEFIRAQAEVARAANDARLAPSKEAQSESAAILNLAKAAAEEIGNQFNLYKGQLEILERQTTAQEGLAENVITGTETAGIGRTIQNL